MDTAWRCRLMIFGIVSLLLVGDLFGYGGGIKSNHPDHHGVRSGGGAVAAGAPTGPAAAAASKFQPKNAEIDIAEGEFCKTILFVGHFFFIDKS